MHSTVLLLTGQSALPAYNGGLSWAEPACFNTEPVEVTRPSHLRNGEERFRRSRIPSQSDGDTVDGLTMG